MERCSHDIRKLSLEKCKTKFRVPSHSAFRQTASKKRDVHVIQTSSRRRRKANKRRELAKSSRVCVGATHSTATRAQTSTHTMFSMAAMTTAMPTVGIRRNATATRVAAAPATAFPAMNGMSSASLGLRSEGACLAISVSSAPEHTRVRARRPRITPESRTMSRLCTVIRSRVLRGVARSARGASTRARTRRFAFSGFWGLGSASVHYPPGARERMMRGFAFTDPRASMREAHRRARATPRPHRPSPPVPSPRPADLHLPKLTFPPAIAPPSRFVTRCRAFRFFFLDAGAASESFSLTMGVESNGKWFMISHGNKVARLHRPADQRKALLRNLTTDLLRYGRITTTMARAKALRKPVEHMITLGKEGSEHKKRQAEAYIFDKELVAALFAAAPERYADRTGGYTRIVRTLRRRGDNAEMAIIELV